MGTFGKGLRGAQLDRLEKEAMGEGSSSKKPERAAAPAKKRTMTQAEFSGYDKVEKKAKGGVMKRTGPDSSRDSKGWERKNDGSMGEDSARARREQASEIERETKRTLSRTQALDASTKMGNPAKYKAGGIVSRRGYGAARGGCK